MVKTYDLIDLNRNCARFEYNGMDRVVRVISINKGNLTGYETKRGKRQINKRYAKVKSFTFTKMGGGKLSLSTR